MVRTSNVNFDLIWLHYIQTNSFAKIALVTVCHKKKKNYFILMLMTEMIAVGIDVKQTVEYTDVIIVDTPQY